MIWSKKMKVFSVSEWFPGLLRVVPERTSRLSVRRHHAGLQLLQVFGFFGGDSNFAVNPKHNNCKMLLPESLHLLLSSVHVLHLHSNWPPLEWHHRRRVQTLPSHVAPSACPEDPRIPAAAPGDTGFQNNFAKKKRWSRIRLYILLMWSLSGAEG